MAPISLVSSGTIDLLKRWDLLGMQKPDNGLKPDLSNLDEIVDIARRKLGL
jgi:hypothetical protein